MKRFIIYFCLSIFALPLFAQMSEKGKSDLAMLNYVTYLYYDIEAQKNNRLYLEDIYNQIENNVLEDKIDEGTQDRLIKMRNQIFEFRMIEIQRDRIELLNENKQSQAIKNVIPSPLYLLSIIQAEDSEDPVRIAMTLAATAVSSVSNYSSAKNDANIEYLKNGWELDDKQMKALHDLSQGALNYKITFVRDNDIKAKDTLTKEMLQEFAQESRKTNLASKISFFERKESRDNYKYFGLYYLAMAKAYYENGQYKECLTAIENYEKNNVQIFRKDYDYAKVLPLVIVAAQKVYPKNYEVYVDKYLFDKNTKDDVNLTIKGNSKETDWEIRYFAAQTCVQLYAKTGDEKYLSEAYSLCFDAVRKYTDVQKELVNEYFEPITTPKTATKADKEVIKQRQKERETELYPISEPLMLNCDMLYALAEKLNKSQKEKDVIRSIVSDAFVFPQLKSTYIYQAKNISKPLDSLLYDLVKETNAEIGLHSYGFKNVFLNEYKTKYQEVLSEKFVTKNASDIALLADKARTTNSVVASWSSGNEFIVPGNYLGQTSTISVTIKELKPDSSIPTVVQFKDVSFKVDKIKKGKDVKKLEEWNCYISFIDETLRKFSYDSKSTYSVVVDVSLGSTCVSFVFFSKKALIGIDFEQVSDKLLTSVVEPFAFKFPEVKANWNKNLEFSKEVDELLTKYILGSVKGLDKNSAKFQQSFINEYKTAYYEQLTNVLGVSSEKELLNILEMAKNSSEIYAALEGVSVTLPARLIYSNSFINLDLIEDDVIVCSKKNIPYKKSNKVSEISFGEQKEEVTDIELDFEELKKFKFHSKKKYRINMNVSSGNNSYTIVFVRNEYGILKTQKFVTLSQYLYGSLFGQMLENNRN